MLFDLGVEAAGSSATVWRHPSFPPPFRVRRQEYTPHPYKAAAVVIASCHPSLPPSVYLEMSGGEERIVGSSLPTLLHVFFPVIRSTRRY